MSFDPDNLLEHAEFARRLALTLARDSHGADDLVQEAWSDLIAAPARDVRSPRGLLATVLRRANARMRRTESRRARRERLASRPELLPSSADITARLEIQRRVLDALDQLTPPYRRALVLRFFDGLSPGEIAERSGEPVETVRTRIKRGLARMRSRLDGWYGSRKAWAAILVPLAPAGTVGTTGPLLVWTVMSMSRTKITLLLFLMIGAAVTWQVWPEPAPPAPRAKAPTSGAMAEAPPSRDKTAPETPPLVRGESDAAGALAVLGSVIAVDASGKEHAGTSGEMEIRTAARPAPLVVPVEEGRFRLELDEPGDVLVTSLVLDGRPARLADPRFAAAPEVELRATWWPAATLRVVDAVSRRDLTGVQVLRGPPIYLGRIHPGSWGPEHELVRDAASPVSLPPVEGVASYWVRAEGYAWDSVEFEHSTGGERLVALQPGARLVVLLDAFETGWDLSVRVYPPEARRFAACLAEGRPEPRGTGAVIAFDGLRAGKVRVDAQFGNWWDPPRVAASTETELMLARTAEVSLRLDEASFPGSPVEVSGTLRLPVGFEHLEVGLKVQRVGGPALRESDNAAVGPDRMVSAGGDGRLRRWELGELTPGPYVIVVEPLQVVHRLEVAPPGRRDVHIEIEELAEVFVRVTDEATGRPADIDAIAWGRPTPDGLRMWTLEQVRLDPEAGGYRFAAPLGRISVSARSDRYEDVRGGLLVRPGGNRLDLTTRELPHRFLRLTDGDTTVPVNWTMRFEIEAVDGDEKGRMGAVESGRAKLVVPRQGRYLVGLRPLPGFEPVEPLVVVFGSDTDEIVVPLRRAR